MSARHVATAATPLAELPNIGPKSAGWLAAVGIRTRADLERIGAPDAYRMVKGHGYNASRNLLWAMQAALLNCHWTRLPARVKRDLAKRLKDPMP